MSGVKQCFLSVCCCYCCPSVIKCIEIFITRDLETLIISKQEVNNDFVFHISACMYQVKHNINVIIFCAVIRFF